MPPPPHPGDLSISQMLLAGPQTASPDPHDRPRSSRVWLSQRSGGVCWEHGGQGERCPKSTCFWGALSQLMVQKPARPGNGASGSRTRTGTGMSWDSGQRTVPWGAQCPRVSISAGRQGPGKLRDPGAVGSGARGAGDGPHHTRMAALAQGSSKDVPYYVHVGPGQALGKCSEAGKTRSWWSPP